MEEIYKYKNGLMLPSEEPNKGGGVIAIVLAFVITIILTIILLK